MSMNTRSGLRLCIVSLLALILLAACATRTPVRSDEKKAGQGYPPDCKWRLAYGNGNDTIGVHPGMVGRQFLYRLAKRKGGIKWDVSVRQGTVLYNGAQGSFPQSTDYVEVAEIGGQVLRRINGYQLCRFAFNATGDKVALTGRTYEERMGEFGIMEEFGIHVWDIKTGELRRLNETLDEEGREVTPEGVNPGWPRTVFGWVGDDKIVAVWPEKSIESLDLSTGKRTKLVSPGTHPSASPDGRYLAYNKSDRLVLRDLTTNDEDDLGPFWGGCAVWSPDSAFFAHLEEKPSDSKPGEYAASPVEVILLRVADCARYTIGEFLGFSGPDYRFVDTKTLDRLNRIGSLTSANPVAPEQK